MSKHNEELVDFAILSRKYETILTKKFKNRVKYEEPNPNELKSHIPGTIVEVTAKKGDSLKQGDLVLVLEAMKMRNRILMPFDGKVKEILVTKDEKIPKGHLMVVVE